MFTITARAINDDSCGQSEGSGKVADNRFLLYIGPNELSFDKTTGSDKENKGPDDRKYR